MYEFDEADAVEQVCQRLMIRFPAISAATVHSTVQELRANLEGPVRAYVPLLVERAATDMLSAIVVSHPPPEVC